MNNTKLIFYDYTELYEIFYELKQFLKFELRNIESKEDLNIEAKKIDDYLIISKKIHPNLNNQLVIDLLPSPIIKIVDKINIEILKNNFSKKSKISVGKYRINLNSKEIIYENRILAEHFTLTGKEFTGDDVDIDIWYKNSQWVKMIFYKDGSEIEYFLKDFDNNE